MCGLASSPSFTERKEPQVKQILSAILALVLVAGIAAPAFAWDETNCPFTDASMCKTETIAPTSGD